MNNSHLKLFFDNITGQRFRNMGYLPRWIIFLIDVFIVLVANIITYFIIYNLTKQFYSNINLPIRYGLIVLVNAIFFILYRTYSGIIRHSTFIDGLKLLVSTLTSFFFLLTINYTWLVVQGHRLYLSTALFISFFVSFILLFLFRIIVKRFFEKFMNVEDSKKLINTVIFGADANAISVANALRTEVPSRFRLRGFIDKYHHNKTSKRILNLPIVSQNRKIHVMLRAMKAEALIIAEKGLSKEETIAIVEECLEYNFKVYTVPLITDWEDEQQISNKVKSFAIEDLLERKPIVLHMAKISAQIKGKTVLITGAAGSIGSEITRQVMEFNPRRILILDQAETPLHTLTLEVLEQNERVTVIPLLTDIRNKQVLEEVFSTYNPDVVYHAAAYKHVPLMESNPSQAVYTNIIGTKNLVDLSLQYNVMRFVMVSTDKAVNPSNVMGASKRIAEKYVQSIQFSNDAINQSGTKFITTRFGNVLGSNGSVVPLFTKQIEAGGPITITHPDIIRYFMTIPEACQLVLEAGTMGNGGEIFIFDMGAPVKIIDLANKMIRLAGFIPDKDIEIKIIGLRPGEKLYEELLNDTSKTLPTHNEKIMIAEEGCEDYESILEAVKELALNAKSLSKEEIVSKMKQIVPEFKSMNSEFQNLDF